ncbi:7217_t:CDS:2, partial [Cetraspora pellucida]
KKMESLLTMLAADDQIVRQKCPDKHDHANIDDTIVLFEPIECATRLLSALSYPMHVANAIYQKLDSYWPILDKTSQVSLLFNLRITLIAFK